MGVVFGINCSDLFLGGVEGFYVLVVEGSVYIYEYVVGFV